MRIHVREISFLSHTDDDVCEIQMEVTKKKTPRKMGEEGEDEDDFQGYDGKRRDLKAC